MKRIVVVNRENKDKNLQEFVIYPTTKYITMKEFLNEINGEIISRIESSGKKIKGYSVVFTPNSDRVKAGIIFE